MANGTALIALWTLLGLVCGVGLDYLVRALVARRNDLVSPSCRSCAAPKLDLRLLPLLSASWRCPSCYRHLGLRALILQLGIASVFGAMAWRSPFEPALLIYSGYALILALVFMVDLEHRLIFNIVTYPGMLLSLAAGAALYGPPMAIGVQRALVGGLFAGAVFLAMYLLAVLLYRRDDALGLGDVKLAALIGLMVGWPGAVAAILLGSLAGGVIGIFLIAQRRSGKATMPYGTALSFGALLSILWQQPIR